VNLAIDAQRAITGSPVTRIMWGTIPYVLCMMLQIVILCVFPEIATWLPDHLMGITH
jgi:TRAP-type C4-dicarboxylate transport system permease large subunit